MFSAASGSAEPGPPVVLGQQRSRAGRVRGGAALDDAVEHLRARGLGERGQLTASIAQAKGKISETELKILQVDQDFRSGVAKELADIRAKYADAIEKQVTAKDQTEKLEIRAPQDGVVLQIGRAHV